MREGASFGQLLTTINAVLYDLKSPAMFATFAGLQRGDANAHDQLDALTAAYPDGSPVHQTQIRGGCTTE